MVEINSTGNCFIDRNRLGSETSSLLYANSLFYCLPVGSNSEGLNFIVLFKNLKKKEKNFNFRCIAVRHNVGC